MKSKGDNPLVGLLPKVIPLKLLLRSLPVSEIPGGSRNRRSADRHFAHMDITRIFLHENIHVNVVILFAGEVAKIS